MFEQERARMLVVDVSESHRKSLAEVLRAAGFDVSEAEDWVRAIEDARHEPDLILVGRASHFVGSLQDDAEPGQGTDASRGTEERLHLVVQKHGTEAGSAERQNTVEARGRLAAIVDSCEDAILSKDLSGVITSWNRSAESVFGYPAAEAIGRHISLIIPEDRMVEEGRILQSIRRGEVIEQFETVRRRKDGVVIDVALTISPVRDDSGRIIGASKIARDITDRKHAAQKLQHIEDRFRKIFTHAGTGISISDTEGRCVQCNPAFCTMTGYSEQELHEIAASALMHPDDLEEERELIRQLIAGTRPYGEIENRFVRKDGSSIWVKKVVSVLGEEQGTKTYLMALVTDITEGKTYQAKLENKVEERTHALVESLTKLEREVAMRRKTEEQLRELSSRVLRLQDEERRRIARELHDSVGQVLTALKVMLSALEAPLDSMPQAREILATVNTLSDEALKEVRTVSYLLHPPMLDEIGVCSAAEWYVEGFRKLSDIEANVDLERIPRLSRSAELALFRVLQECLTNVHRHSGSDKVDISLIQKANQIVLRVQDYGRGISPEGMSLFSEIGTGAGVGLGGMRQRIRELGGQLTIESDGNGTTVVASIPLERCQKSEEGDVQLRNAGPAA